MMCEHCENHVSAALRSIEGITEAKADHNTGIVEAAYTGEVSEESMAAAVKDAGYEYKGVKKEGEKKNMTKTVKIEGMMCEHCEATVKKALEGVEGVVSADVSKDRKDAVVTLSKDVDDAVLKDAVEAKDYKVTGITA